MTENIWAQHLVCRKEKVYLKKCFCIVMHMQCVFDFFLNLLGRKEGAEGGIMFDKESEKEEWEEDQKVSLLCLVGCLLIY